MLFRSQKHFKNKLNSNNYFRDGELITFNKNNINELSLDIISNIKDSNLIIQNEKEITFNSEMSLFDLMSFYRILLSKNFISNIKLIEKVYSIEKEFFNFDDINQISHKSNELIEENLLKNNEIVKFFNLQSFLIENFEIKSNTKKFYGWNIFDEKNEFTIFIGFNNQRSEEHTSELQSQD